MTEPKRLPFHLRTDHELSGVCDICGRARNRGNHDKCSKQRQAAYRAKYGVK